MSLSSIYTESNNCRDCYKCIRECPVKAIRIQDHKASVVPELCIFCGHCTRVCPVGAKKVREDLSTVKMLVNSGHDVVMSLAPSFLTEFSDYEAGQLVAAIKKLGIKAVEFTAQGADRVNQATEKYLKESQSRLAISSCCFSVVQLINKYYPHLNSNIIPVMSPLMAHAQSIKNRYGKDVKVIFAGPCISKKNEAEHYIGWVDAVITFDRLQEWLNDEGIAPEFVETQPIQLDCAEGLLYPTSGGLLNGIREREALKSYCCISVTGEKEVLQVLEGLDESELDRPLLLELMICSGGCINGPGTSNTESIIHKTQKIYSFYHQFKGEEYTEEENIQQPCEHLEALQEKEYSYEEIQEALIAVGKHSVDDELNCGGCGYESCRDFVKAMLEGRAETDMCVSYMRNVAHNKASLLLQKIPYGVVMVDSAMKVVESNESFAEMMGGDLMNAWECNPGLNHADFKKIFPEWQLFSNLLSSGEAAMDKDIRHGGQLIRLSVFSLEAGKMVCGILQSMKSPEVRKEEVIRRSRVVLKENLDTVQKIAFLLGENASKTEVMLNSIVESFDEREV